MKQNKATTIGGDFAAATGKIRYGFTNDYMFRVILQKNQRVLKALICSLLHLRPDDIQSLEITNPITPGESIDAKEFILDISISMNNNTIINLEMQVKNQLNWEERSLSYLCRSFDGLYKGDDYSAAGPAIHIGFLDFTPFPDAPEFFATYKLLNVKNHRLYSSKFMLGVVDLTQINLANEDDKAWGIDHWARLFKASTWEELKMIAKENEAMQEASETLYSMHCEKTIQDMCRAREDSIRLENTYKKMIAGLESDVERLIADNEMLNSDNQRLTAEIAKLRAELNKKD